MRLVKCTNVENSTPFALAVGTRRKDFPVIVICAHASQRATARSGWILPPSHACAQCHSGRPRQVLRSSIGNHSVVSNQQAQLIPFTGTPVLPDLVLGWILMLLTSALVSKCVVLPGLGLIPWGGNVLICSSSPTPTFRGAWPTIHNTSKVFRGWSPLQPGTGVLVSSHIEIDGYNQLTFLQKE